MRWSPVAIAASVVGLAVVAGAAGMVLTGDGAGEGGWNGEGVHIALVTPPEPPPVDGPMMDVGPVVDGYVHHPFVEQAAYEDDYSTAWLDDASYEPSPPPEPRVPVRIMTSSQPSQDEPLEAEPAAGRPLSFGFDQPRPDYAEARRLRRERMDMAASQEALPRPDGTVAPSPAAPRGPDMFY